MWPEWQMLHDWSVYDPKVDGDHGEWLLEPPLTTTVSWKHLCSQVSGSVMGTPRPLRSLAFPSRTSFEPVLSGSTNKKMNNNVDAPKKYRHARTWVLSVDLLHGTKIPNTSVPLGFGHTSHHLSSEGLSDWSRKMMQHRFRHRREASGLVCRKCCWCN